METLSPCVLVADDDPGIRNMLVDIITDAGYRVETVASGPDAVLRVREVHPRLVLLDLQMPGMSGQDVLATLRAGGDQVPILFMSAGLRVKFEAERCGADGYLAKPFDIDDVLQMLEQFCGPSAA